MSNLLKRAYVASDSVDRKVIDSNDLVAQWVERQIQLQREAKNGSAALFTPLEGAGSDGFVEGLDAENVELLLADTDTGEEAAQPVPTLEEINEEIRLAREAK